ncbi:hypothetical protein DPMN_056147 [Dreissena polymorpha]|uniref:Uncharacterized protein n=1 Tax=Dreissena polymorpha TaxID=45954 RepID=A0A9D4HT83_DREPO|nr:hypothetical protein DPMN_056147 [Dreissena polymorpha]
MISHKDTGCQSINGQTLSRENENIMLAIRSKVTNFILKQMNKQLENSGTNLNTFTSVPTVIKVNKEVPSTEESQIPTFIRDESQGNTSLNKNIVNQNIRNNGTIPNSQYNSTNNCENERSNV